MEHLAHLLTTDPNAGPILAILASIWMAAITSAIALAFYAVERIKGRRPIRRARARNARR